MKFRYLLFVMVIIFTGGFWTGIFYSTNNNHQQAEQLKDLTKETDKKAIQNPNPNPEIVAEKSKVIIGYLQDFRDPNVLDYSQLTHVIFSFAHPLKDGSLTLNGDSALSNLRTVVSQAHKLNTKVMLAVGGWFHMQGGESYPYFKEAITNPTSRSKLVNELIKVVEQENLDGIDIDFEHPRSTDDAKNLTVFTQELSEKLHNNGKELSIAVNAKIHSVTGTEINNVIYDPSMFQYVDHVNIMAYDGQWDGDYNAANLSPYRYSEEIVSYWSKLFDSQHLSKEKLVLGVPFYAQPEDPKIKQVSYETIIKNNPANADKDSVYMNGTTYYYNGLETVHRKTILAMDNGFGGMMLWEAGHDANGANSLTAAIFHTLNGNEKYTYNSMKK